MADYVLLVLLQEGDPRPVQFYLVPSSMLLAYDLDKLQGKEVNGDKTPKKVANDICTIFCRCLGDIGEVDGWDGKRDFKDYVVNKNQQVVADRIVVLRWAV